MCVWNCGLQLVLSGKLLKGPQAPFYYPPRLAGFLGGKISKFSPVAVTKMLLGHSSPDTERFSSRRVQAVCAATTSQDRADLCGAVQVSEGVELSHACL